VVLGPERLPVAIRTASHWIRLIRSTANSVKAELEQELKLQDLHNDLKKAERLQMNNLSPELQESIEQLKAAAQSVNRPYQGENEIRPPREPAQAEPATPVAPRRPPQRCHRSTASERACARQRVRSQGRVSHESGRTTPHQPSGGAENPSAARHSAILLVFISIIYFSNNIYDRGPAAAQPVAGRHQHDSDGCGDPFITPIKLTLVVSFFVAIPYLLYQAWAFHRPRPVPARTAPDHAAGGPPVPCCSMPAWRSPTTWCSRWCSASSPAPPPPVTVATDIASYLDFVLTLFFAFRWRSRSRWPPYSALLDRGNHPKSLREKRPYVIVGVFVVGMLLTPPDVFSQTLLAIPMWGLWEIGLFFARFYVKKEDEEQQQTEEGS
jgi:sec-independent protein translocase protein TatC